MTDKELSQQAKKHFPQIRKAERLIKRLQSAAAGLRSSLTSQSHELKRDKVQRSGGKTQLEMLRKSGADAAALQEQITRLQADNTAKDQKHAAEIKKIKIDNAVDKALTDARAINPVTVKPLLAAFLETVGRLSEKGGYG